MPTRSPCVPTTTRPRGWRVTIRSISSSSRASASTKLSPDGKWNRDGLRCTVSQSFVRRSEGRVRPVQSPASISIERIRGADLEPSGRRERLQGLGAALQRARVQRGEPDALEALDERGRLPAAALVEMDAARPAVQARSRHGREAVTDQEQGRHGVGEHTCQSPAPPPRLAAVPLPDRSVSCGSIRWWRTRRGPAGRSSVRGRRRGFELGADDRLPVCAPESIWMCSRTLGLHSASGVNYVTTTCWDRRRSRGRWRPSGTSARSRTEPEPTA